MREVNVYAEVEKAMFDLKEAGKRDTPEYDKLIALRAAKEKDLHHCIRKIHESYIPALMAML